MQGNYAENVLYIIKWVRFMSWKCLIIKFLQMSVAWMKQNCIQTDYNDVLNKVILWLTTDVIIFS